MPRRLPRQSLRQWIRRAIALIAALLLCAPAAAQDRLLVIGTGSVVGLYYPVGGAASLIVNDAADDLLLTVKVTDGSVSNLQQLTRGDVDLALVQSDVAFEAFAGSGDDAALRALIGLHPEPLHLVCRRDAEVRELTDIVGRRVNLGVEGSGILPTVRTVLDAYRIDETLDLDAQYRPPDDNPQLLADGEIDCFFYTVGIGGAAIHAAAALTDVALVPLDGPELAGLITDYPYYAYVTVPGGTYRGVDDPVTIFGVRALLVATETFDEAVAFTITRTILDGFERLRATYPALATLERGALTRGLGIPLHPGAERAFELP